MIQNYFSVGQLSKIFGVSIFTINDWIQEGRFINVKNSEKSRIVPSTLWLSRGGKLYTVAEILNEWEVEKEKQGANEYDKDEDKFLSDQITLYERKYEGNFENTLGLKEELSWEEETDKVVWSYLRKK
ncbi:hypothetical protein [Psychrobacillus sp. NPDC093180]|uniref:hypothetical protein n=1 Tax=Psychrobacillus sp. NPDC093180 TaxID=3364489 RepID=UPI0038287CD8